MHINNNQKKNYKSKTKARIDIAKWLKILKLIGIVYGFSAWEMKKEMGTIGCRDGVVITAPPSGNNA